MVSLQIRLRPASVSFTFKCFPKQNPSPFCALTKQPKILRCLNAQKNFLESGKKKLEAGLREFNFFFPEDGDGVDINHYVYRDIL